MKSNKRVEQILKHHKEELVGDYNVSEIGIFGSYVRGEESEKSDVDIVIETDMPDMFKLVHIKNELEGLLHKSVDIIRNRDKMNPYLKKRIIRDAIYV